MAAVKTQIKKDPKEITKPKTTQNPKAKKETEKPTEKKTMTKNETREKKPTQGQKLLEAMTAQKAAKEALMKGVTNTKVSFDDEGNEKVETVVQKLDGTNKPVSKKKPVTEEKKQSNARPAQKKPEKRQKETSEADSAEVKEPSEKRAKKEKKSKAELEEIRKDNKQEEAMEYVRTFANDRKNWKFKKVQQIWILNNLYKIPESDFNHVLEYLKDLQGSSREKTKKEAEEKIPKKAISNSLTGYAGAVCDDDDFDAEKLLNQAPKEQPKEESEETPEIKRAKMIVQVLL